jgi:hypothetical protein
MQHLPLALASGHLFVTIQGERWLVDTGSPNSFGRETTLELDDQSFRVAESYFGLDSAALSGLVGEPLSGLIGGDILGKLDIELDVEAGSLLASSRPLALAGAEIALEDFMGVPILEAESEAGTHRMFFDTGAPISFQHDSLEGFEQAGELVETSFLAWASSPPARTRFRSRSASWRSNSGAASCRTSWA